MLIDTTVAIRKELLKTARTIAMVGLSPKEQRPSNMVARYLIGEGFTVIPVNPGQTEILGRRCYASLLEIPDKIDIVNIFRRAEAVPPIVQGAIALGARAVWMQEGIRHEVAAAEARQAGLVVVMDRCIKGLIIRGSGEVLLFRAVVCKKI
ncbi:CoA-binding protein [Desulfotalea psychrophila]|uniref:CoA-binding domain-containing protein n=1 Tax=Desulfotalea psychrophila (strain LSv54 / DSM 12343) TaxID=177439 RepID=Q6AS29_DESPS|nr:CoA-binding protein [Desulfotalea psychrophila]CAG34846.1 conserved hypothetical protein [Desulfotalea psychrophila LSv54]